VKHALLWDSSAVLAVLDEADSNHGTARALLERLAEKPHHAVITNYLLVEAHALLLRRLGRGVAREWLEKASPPVLQATARDEERGREIIARHRDKNYSLCDAISFAVMEARAIRRVFTFDRHFRQYGRFEVIGV